MQPSDANVQHIVTFLHKKAEGLPSILQCHIPDNIKIDFGARWEQNMVGKVAERSGLLNQLNQVTSMFGARLGHPILGALAYSGVDTPKFSITTTFRADSSSTAEVMTPVRQLLDMCTPDILQGIAIVAPGPNLADELQKVFSDRTKSAQGEQASQGTQSDSSDQGNSSRDGEAKVTGETISVQLGMVMNIPSVVITNVSLVFSSQVGPDLRPTKCDATISFQPFIPPYRKDLKMMLGVL